MAADAAAARLADLAASHRLVTAQVEQLGTLLALLDREPTAPTSVRDPAQAVDRHVADSLAGLAVPELAAASAIADLGSGAGLPGLVLAVALPGASVRLLESQARKCAFIERAAREMALGNVHAVCARAEDWRAGIGANDAVTARALAPQPVVLEYAAPLLQPGGVLVDWRGRRNPHEEAAGASAAAALGLVPVAVLASHPFPGAREHHIHVFRKERPTPARFPRRAGVARKRPLG